ncbi:DUF2486 family protein [Paraburkholderia dinghuensis]|uniref:DUF2486 family protein n=1 Tax=Paraburkholderia dinghuensis TaxID=2305225 RepID=A0A3N6NB64_9BURK|nr:DUF2486 family protein [Paraburkholderia dinghuensis]
MKEVFVPDEHEVNDASIPLLTDILVPGNVLRARGGVAPAAVPAGVEGLFAGDVDALAERLRGRCLGWLTGDGRGVIESRCSAALQEHSRWLVGQVSREIGLALESELKGWVKAAVREELAARATHGPGSGPGSSAGGA